MEPYETGLSEYQRRTRRMLRRVQPYLRNAATEAGLFSGCGLSRCRRAKQCLGRHPDEEIGSSHYKNFPPCVATHELQGLLIGGMRRAFEKVEQKLLARGYSPEEIDEIDRKNRAAMWDADDWPEDPLARVSAPPDRVPAPARRRKRPKHQKAAGKAG